MKILFALFFLFAGTASLSAQVETPAAKSTMAQTEKTPVKPEELPQAVKNVLATDAYKGWTLQSASLVKADGQEYYEIMLKKEMDMLNVKLNKEGIRVEE